MKKKFAIMLIIIIILTLFPIQVFAEDTCNHTWSPWEIYYEPTCGEPGQQERYCLNCYAEEYTDIPATSKHQWDDWYTVKSATISKTGLKKRECWDCAETQTKVIPKLKPYIKLSKKAVKLQETKTCSLKISYAKGDSIKKCETNNKQIATVSKSGKITANQPGTAKITITTKSGKSATCQVTVSTKKKAKKTTATTNHSNTSTTVYWTPNGTVYHCTKNCPTLSRSRTIYSSSKSNCPKPRACKVCY